MAVYNDGLTVDYGTANAVAQGLSTHLVREPHLGGFGAVSDGATDVFTALTNALTDVSAVYLGGNYLLNTNFTIASGKTVVLLPSATLTIAAAKTLTVASGGSLVRMGGSTLTVTGTLTVSGSKFQMAKANATGMAALTENTGAVGGSNDGDMPALVTTANATYLQAEQTALNAAVRELATKVNQIITALTA